MSRVLVTGDKGYIGSRLRKKLEDLGHEVFGVDRKSYGPHQGLDLCSNDFKVLYSGLEPEYVFHLAAIPRVPYSMKHPEEVLENNITSTIRVLEYARREGAKRVIYSSSSSVVGNGDGPTSPYGASKLIPETLCKTYSDVYGLDTVCLRYFNVYSEDQEADGPYTTAIANFMHCIREGISPFITGDGEQRRDMLHVSDAISANIFCMNYDGLFGGKWFDTATGKNISLNEVKQIVEKYHPEVVFEKRPERLGDVRETRADTKPLADLGWTTSVDIISGIENCFNFEV
jgi:UDP-glucose 4-epimerase